MFIEGSTLEMMVHDSNVVLAIVLQARDLHRAVYARLVDMLVALDLLAVLVVSMESTLQL